MPFWNDVPQGRKYLTFLVDCFVSVRKILCRGWFYNPNQNFSNSLNLKVLKVNLEKDFSFYLKTILFCFAGIPATHGKPSSYSIRVDNTVPLVTQAPAVQPLQIRPGVLSQVGNNSLFLHMYSSYTQVGVLIHL